MSITPQSSTNHSIVKQYRALLAISETIISQRDLTQLFHDLSERLKKIIHFDYITLMLYDREHDLMRARPLLRSAREIVGPAADVVHRDAGRVMQGLHTQGLERIVQRARASAEGHFTPPARSSSTPDPPAAGARSRRRVLPRTLVRFGAGESLPAPGAARQAVQPVPMPGAEP